MRRSCISLTVETDKQRGIVIEAILIEPLGRYQQLACTYAANCQSDDEIAGLEPIAERAPYFGICFKFG
jgi:hypothetical protein